MPDKLPDAVVEGDDITKEERQVFIDLLWESKKLIPRGVPYQQFIVDAENTLWGWKMPENDRCAR